MYHFLSSADDSLILSRNTNYGGCDRNASTDHFIQNKQLQAAQGNLLSAPSIRVFHARPKVVAATNNA
jgi:hypothetical protein